MQGQFVVSGIPISAQSKQARRSWAKRVAEAARLSLSDDSIAGTYEVSVFIAYFYEGETNLDVDNIAKPILDAMAGIYYSDDAVVSQLTVRKTRLFRGLVIVDPPASLAECLDAGGDFVFIRVAEPPDHGAIP